MTTNTTAALQNFIDKYLQLHKDSGKPLLVEHDSDWPSPAIVGEPDSEGNCPWQPFLRSNTSNLSKLENGLDIKVNSELQDYFCYCWSDNLNAKSERGNLQLLLPWNEDDFVRLQQNLVAHVLMKRRLRQRDTLFFAVTDEEDFILSVLNDTGEVVLERVGLEPQEVLADSLVEFLEQLEPNLSD